MGVYSSGTSATRTNNRWAGYALPANPGYTRFLRSHIYVEGGGTNTTVQRWFWQRVTALTVTAATAEKASTRSPAFAGTAGNAESVAGTLAGNPYYYYGAGQERFLTMRHLAYPRPNANPVLIDAEQGVVGANVTTGVSNVYDNDTVFSDDVPHVPADHLPRRRSRDAGWWHIYRHGTELSGAGANQIVSNGRAALVYQVGRNRNVGWSTHGFILLNSSGPTTNFLTLTCSTNVSALLQNQTGKPLAGAVTDSATRTSQTAKPLAAAVTDSAGLARQAAKPLAASQNASSAITRRMSRSYPVSVTGSAAVSRQTAKTLAVSVTGSAATTRRIARTLQAALNDSASLTKQTAKTLAASLNDSASIALTKVHVLLLACSTNVSAAVTRQVTRVLAAALNDSATVTKQTSKPVTATNSTSTTLQRRPSKTFAASETASAVAQRRVGRSFAATATAGASVTRRTGRTLAASTSSSAVLRRQPGKLFVPQVILGAVATMVKQGIAHALGRSFGVHGRQAGFGVSASEATMRTAPRQAGLSAGASQAELGVDASQANFDEPDPLP